MRGDPPPEGIWRPPAPVPPVPGQEVLPLGGLVPMVDYAEPVTVPMIAFRRDDPAFIPPTHDELVDVIRDSLDELHCTLWGRAHDLSEDGSKDAAAEWLATEIQRIFDVRGMARP